MEPVPETERMEEFRSSPLPSLRLPVMATLSPGTFDQPQKPPTMRRSTDPVVSSPTSPSWLGPAAFPYRPRTTSPLSGYHSRSKSAASLAPPMARTRSMPAFNAGGTLLTSPQLRSQSPSGSPSRARVPKKPADEVFPASPTRTSVLDPERRNQDRSVSPTPGISSIQVSSHNQRTSSPLRHVTHSSTGSLPLGVPTNPSSVASSLSYRPYDSLSSSYAFGSSMPSSSVPSTPTSARSRSPSISSLETIPDSPDAEEAAMEAERIAQLKADADAAEGGDTKGRNTLDVPTRGRTMSFGSRDKRKRWSVCGAERRGDLDLETIWED